MNRFITQQEKHAVDSPEDREISRFKEKLIDVVHHSCMKLSHVHDLSKVRIVLQCQRSFASAGVSLKT